jgi:uncharacterized protein YccT (UPF0319 family)
MESKDVQTARALKSSTIIVKTANALTRPIHHRMPVILDPRDANARDRQRSVQVNRRIYCACGRFHGGRNRSPFARVV